MLSSCLCKNAFRKVQLLMTNTKNFPGIIAPKVNLFVKINITKATAATVAETKPAAAPSISASTCHDKKNDIRRKVIANRDFNSKINTCLCQCPCSRIDRNQDEMKFYAKRQKPVCHTSINNNEQQQFNKAVNVNNLDLYRMSCPLPRPSSSSSSSSSTSYLTVLASYRKHLKYCELCRCYERVFCNKA